MRFASTSRKFASWCVAVVAGHQRHLGLFHQRLGLGLAAHGADRLGRRADEHQAGLGAGGGELLVLRQEAVARMDRLGTARLGRLDDASRRADSFPCRSRTDAHRLVAERHVAWLPASASEYTATVRMPRRRAVVATRQAISPRLAIRILSNMSPPSRSVALDCAQWRSVALSSTQLRAGMNQAPMRCIRRAMKRTSFGNSHKARTNSNTRPPARGTDAARRAAAGRRP